MKRGTIIGLGAWVGLAIGVISGAAACGKPSEEAAAGAKTVNGRAGFGSQCPGGTISDPLPAKLALYDCPGAADPMELIEPPQELMLQADCKERTIAIRSAPGSRKKIDTLWKIFPDNTFSVKITGDWTIIRDSASRGGSCVSYTAMDVWGTVNCPPEGSPNLDQAEIHVNVDWWLGKGNRPDVGAPDAPECRLPKGCHLQSKATIAQCR